LESLFDKLRSDHFERETLFYQDFIGKAILYNIQ